MRAVLFVALVMTSDLGDFESGTGADNGASIESELGPEEPIVYSRSDVHTLYSLLLEEVAADAPSAAAGPGDEWTPLFECSWLSFGCIGGTFHGYVVDDVGRVWSYDRHGRPWDRGAALYGSTDSPQRAWYAGTLLRQKFTGSVFRRRVTGATLRLQFARAHLARLGKPTAWPALDNSLRAHKGNCLAYLWDKEWKVYQEVILSSPKQVNGAPAAQRLSNWLESLFQGKVSDLPLTFELR